MTSKIKMIKYLVILRTISICLFFVSSYYNGILDILQEDPCRDMISPPLRTNQEPSASIWKPSFCSMHKYSQKEFEACWSDPKLHHNNVTIFLFGDSHQRNMFVSIARKFDASYEGKGKFYLKLTFVDNKRTFRMEYRYLPSLNGQLITTFEQWKQTSFLPRLIVISCTLHPILDSKASKVSRNQFRQNLTLLLTHLDNLARKTTVLWYVPPPVVEEKVIPRRKVITDHEVALYKDIIIETLSRTRVKLWTSVREIATDSRHFYVDGVHVGQSSMSYYINILNNFHCNQRFKFRDGTCCTFPEDIKEKHENSLTYQWALLLLLGVAAIIVATQILSNWSKKTEDPQVFSGNDGAAPSVTLLNKLTLFSHCAATRILTFAVCLGQVYLSDRIPLFSKEELDSTSPIIFLTITLVMLAMEIRLFQASAYLDKETIPKKLIINESRGLIVVFHLAVRLNPSHNEWPQDFLVHLMESTFLVMEGMEMSYWYLSGKPMKAWHYVKVFIKQNMLFVCLCRILGQPYVTYGIFPAAAISYSFVYLVLALPPRRLSETDNLTTYETDGIKVFIISCLFIMFALTEENSNIFGNTVSRGVFATKEDTLEQWQLRWRLDKFSVIYGALMGILVHHVSQKLSISGSVYSITLLVGSFISFFVSFYGIRRFSSLDEISNIYPLVTICLVIGSILFRGFLLKVFNYHSRILFHLGTLWREIYLLHFHIWCSNEGTAFLVLVPFYKILNLLIVTITVFVSSEAIHKATYVSSNL